MGISAIHINGDVYINICGCTSDACPINPDPELEDGAENEIEVRNDDPGVYVSVTGLPADTDPDDVIEIIVNAARALSEVAEGTRRKESTV